MKKIKEVIIEKSDRNEEEIMDSIGQTSGIAEEDVDTFEWIPSYYCEMRILKSPYATEEFVNEITQEIYKVKGWLRKRLKYIGDYHQILRYSLEDIRSSTLRSRMQDLISKEGFECQLPNNHVRFGGVKTDLKTGMKITTLGCLGKTIAEKIPKNLYYSNESGVIIKYILVREHEKALFVKDGKIITTLNAGRHDIRGETMFNEIIEIYYVDIGNITARWGTSVLLTDSAGTKSATQVKLRINGSVILRIKDISNFLVNIVKNQPEYYEGNIETYVKDKIIEIVNSEMSRSDPLNIYQNVEEVMMAVQLKSNEFLEDAGIEIVNLSVSSCKFDDETEEIFRKRLHKIKVDGAEADAQFDRRIDELKELQNLGIDINEYVRREQQATMIPTIKSPSYEERTTTCPFCGVKGETGKYCQNCGNFLSIVCPNCGKNPGTGKFCQECGSPLK